MKKNKKPKKRITPLKAVLLAICILLLVILIAVGSVVIALAVKYHETSYEYQPPVDREESYVMPDYPELDESSGAEYIEDTLPPEYPETTPPPETTAPDTEVTTLPEETTTIPEETTAIPEETTVVPEESTEIPEETTSPETDPPETTSPPPETTSPPETVPPIINTPETTRAPYVPPSNPDASFENSPNAVSVYGKTPIYKVSQKDPNIVNILVMGTDSLDITRDRGRSDAMIIVSYNKKTGSVKMTSLLRDALVPIAGYDWNRINTAYYFGGVGLAINTVNEIFDLDIQQFVVIDLNGAKNLINKVGGADVTLTQAEADLYNAYWGTKYTAGVNHMEGDHLLGHMRNRAIGSDFERTRRQRDVILALFNKIVKEKSAAEIYDLIDYVFGIVKTNIPFSALTSYATSVIGNLSKIKIESQSVPYSDSFKYAWYRGKAIISFNITDAAKRINKFIYG